WMCGRQLGSYPETGFGGIDGSCGATEDGRIIALLRLLRLSSSQIVWPEAELVSRPRVLRPLIGEAYRANHEDIRSCAMRHGALGRFHECLVLMTATTVTPIIWP